ncbi:MAG: hypothetical protein P8R54_22500 [Myxococcota bacterium]|nr:hypothetical protein [Myxococcota bacterium]
MTMDVRSWGAPGSGVGLRSEEAIDLSELRCLPQTHANGKAWACDSSPVPSSPERDPPSGSFVPVAAGMSAGTRRAGAPLGSVHDSTDYRGLADVLEGEAGAQGAPSSGRDGL